MRTFVVLGHDAPTEPGIQLSDLPGAGRLDLLCRAVSAGLFTSHGVREDSQVVLVLRDALAVRFEGAEVRGAPPDERGLAGLVDAALETAAETVGPREVESRPGVYVARRGLAETLDALLTDGTTLWQLHRDGEDVAGVGGPDDVVCVLSDHREFAADETDTLAEHGARRVRLGPVALHANHAIAVGHNHLDRRG